MPEAPELYREYPQPGEDAAVERLIPLLKKLILQDYLTGTTYRDTHAKGHAAVRATFTVPGDLPEELRVGLFAEPATYPAWIRFSNLSPSPQADRKRDIRALSIKLMDVPGERLWQDPPEATTLDFIMMGSSTFLAPDLFQFVALEEAIYRGQRALAWFLLTHRRIAATILRGQTRCANILEIPYYSQTAYAFGERAVQYHMAPHQPPQSTFPVDPPNNFLRARLAEDLTQKAAAFDFMVQFQTDPVKMPIEDPMVAWDPARSPYRKVATVRIPPQRFDAPAQVQFCEDIAFNPWRTRPEHRPLGGINRARLKVYPAIAAFRHARNNTHPVEPTPALTFT